VPNDAESKKIMLSSRAFSLSQGYTMLGPGINKLKVPPKDEREIQDSAAYHLRHFKQTDALTDCEVQIQTYFNEKSLTF
jgi:hypothetical protein